MTSINPQSSKNPSAVSLGALGGKARASKYSEEQRAIWASMPPKEGKKQRGRPKKVQITA